MKTKSLFDNQLVLRAAWRRVSNWYGGVELVPQPEKALFELQPQRRLEQIGRELATGSFIPDPFRLVPFPKSGGALRHYTIPTVGDQVAFAVFGVLLGPLIDLATERFAFGNRWFRGLVRHRTTDNAQWVARPYTIDSDRFYLPYRRDFALFRRAAAWTVSAMLGQRPDSESARKNAVALDDYADFEIPSSCRPGWWTVDGRRTKCESGVWTRLDLQLAYPSVRITQLRVQLRKLLSELKFEDIAAQLAGYPKNIVDALTDETIRQELATHLCDALDRIEYATGPVGKLWEPLHTSHELPGRAGHGVGLPTGLAISGNLLHAYLYSLDKRIKVWMDRRETGQKAAFLRFADDIILIAESRNRLPEAIDAVWCAIEDDSDAILAAPKRDGSAMNLRVNWTKVEPEDVAKKLKEYLEAQHWTPCAEKDCQRLTEPKSPAAQPVRTFAAWWKSQPKAQRKNWLTDDELRADRVGPFVTHLVERMSQLGKETLTERFGTGAERRIADLHDLVRLRIDDTHVRADTRLAFAANRLASTFLPNEGSSLDSMEIAEIRRSVGEAVRLAPWKYSLWRAVVQAACRRPMTETASASRIKAENSEASTWLKQMLRRISMTPTGPDSWLKRWPEKLGPCHPSKKLQPLYLSFLRVTFWRAIADVLDSLYRVPGSGSDKSPMGGPLWPSSAWTFRALNEKRASRVADWLGNLTAWAGTLYGNDAGPPSDWWWELDALMLAVLKTTEGTDFIKSPQDTASVGRSSSLVFPKSSPLPGGLSAYLRDSGRVKNSNDLAKMPVVVGWAHHMLSRPLQQSSQLDDAAAALNASFGARDAAAMADRIELSRYLPPADTSLPKRGLKRQTQRRSLDDLQMDEAARRHQMGHTQYRVKTSRPPTLHRLLWAIDSEDATPYIAPAEAPTVSLPIRLSLLFLWQSLQQPGSDAQRDGKGPFVWTFDETVYAALRRARLQYLNGHQETVQPGADITVHRGDGSAWEIPPHSAYFLPSVIQQKAPAPFILELWCDILQFFTAAQGSERFLDALLRSWPSPVHLDERWELRSEVAMPPTIWHALDKILRGVLNGNMDYQSLHRDLLDSIKPVVTQVDLTDFAWDRVDVQLTLDSESDEILMGCIPIRSRTSVHFPPLDSHRLADQMIARVAQVTSEPDWASYKEGFRVQAPPRISRFKRQEIMREIASAFSAPSSTASDNHKIVQGPIVFPEMTLPLEEERAFFHHAVSQGRDALIGLHFQVVPSPYGGRRVRANATKYLTNEALFIGKLVHASDNKVCVWRQFRVRKPLPTHAERALALSLGEAKVQGANWKMLPGNRWFRFEHPQWGDFTIAICSDLLDPSPWHSMQGKILHLLLVAYNKDVDLYDSLTWVRAYECHANVVGTNHGHYGGSFVWTPSARHRREVARLRGNGLFVVADVHLDVRGLALHQIDGLRLAEEQSKRDWERTTEKDTFRYRAPSPGFSTRRPAGPKTR